jgi:hypothetical protein
LVNKGSEASTPFGKLLVEDGDGVGAEVCSWVAPPLLLALPMLVFFLLRFRFLAMIVTNRGVESTAHGTVALL